MKIWYQSSTSLGLDPMWNPYLEALKKHVQEVASDDTTVDVRGVRVTHPLVERSYYAKYLNKGVCCPNLLAII